MIDALEKPLGAVEIACLRSDVIREAMTWLGTPWHHRGRVKGVGVDCAQFLALVYEAAGAIAPVPEQHYPVDWHLSREEPRFLAEVRRHAVPVPEASALPGDVAMFNFGRHAAHGAIVLAWPRIVHAYVNERAVVVSHVGADAGLAKRLAGIWRLRQFVEA